MRQVIELKDRSVETIFGARDFEYLIDKYMGYESAKCYRQQIEELSDCIRDMANYIENYIDDEYVKSDVEEVLKVNGY